MRAVSRTARSMPPTARAGQRPGRRITGTLSGVVALAVLTACSGDDPEAAETSGPGATVPTASAEPSASEEPTTSGGATARLAPPTVSGDVVTGLETPWSIAFLPDGDALVSLRDVHTIVRVTAAGETTEVGEVAGVDPGGEAGLLGLAISPDFATDQYVYAYYTSESDNRIVRMTYDGSTLGEQEVVVDGIARAGNHNGGRITFGPDGMLYAGTGDAAEPSRAQDTDSLNGKILRMTPDGGVPPDNPFGNLVWSYGHRNVQGLAFGEDGRLWASELGQDTWDEVNLIEPGANYGWPEAEGVAETAGLVDPVEQFAPADASPSGIAVVDNQIFMAALRGERLWQIPDPGGQSSLEPVAFFTGTYGRLRAVTEAPDGSLWVLTNNTDGRGSPLPGDDRILRVERGLGAT